MSENDKPHNHANRLIFRKMSTVDIDTLEFAQKLGEQLQVLAVGLTATLQHKIDFLPHDIHQSLMLMHALVHGNAKQAVGMQAPVLSLMELVTRCRRIMDGEVRASVSSAAAPSEPAVAAGAPEEPAVMASSIVDATDRFPKRVGASQPPESPKSA